MNTKTQETDVEKRKRAHLRYLYRDSKTAYLMLLPAFVLVTVFVLIPFGMACVRVFQDYYTKEFVGLNNFKYILKMDSFLKGFRNLAIMVPIIVIAIFFFSFLFALLLKKMPNGTGSAAKIIIYLPHLFSGVIISTIFLFIFNYGGGLITSILLTNGKEPIVFTMQGFWPYLIIILPNIWMSFGYNALVLYAGVINIPKDYYEAASLDGASAFRQLISITLPQMKNYFVLNLINLMTGCLQMFELPLLMTGGGPMGNTMTPMLYLYNLFRDSATPMNVTIAGSLIMMVLIAAINIFVFRVVRSEKSIDG